MKAGPVVVVVGGGIAGVSCVEALIQDNSEDDRQVKQIILVSEERLVKRVINYESRGRQLENFDVLQSDPSELINSEFSNGLECKFIHGTVKAICHSEKYLVIENIEQPNLSRLSFNILCLCNGALPRTLNCVKLGDQEEINKRLIVIRDISTVQDFRTKLADCRHIAIVGNGGISLELVHKITNCKKTWIVRDESIGLPFFDSGAAKFLLDSISDNTSSVEKDNRLRYVPTKSSSERTTFGPALGPNWARDLELLGLIRSDAELEIIYNDEIDEIRYTFGEDEYPLEVLTRSSKMVRCDLVAVAIGVEPNNLDVIDSRLEVSTKDGGILIDTEMRTNLNLIYAAGDTVSCEKWPASDLWFQMRLWTQARQMGFYAGRCIVAHLVGLNPTIYSNFDCFTHCTRFLDFQLILLGQYNGQLLTDTEAKDCEIMARVNPGKDYVKLLIKSGRIVGAVLVGESGLEETIENLIHDRIDVTNCKEHLLDDTVDIEDYFD